MDVSSFAPGTFSLYIKEIAFFGFFFFFLDVCFIRQLLHLKKENKNNTFYTQNLKKLKK